MQPVASTHPSSASLPRDLYDDGTIHTVPPPVLRSDWKTLAWFAFYRSKPLDLDACPALSLSSISFMTELTNRSLLGFDDQTKKPLWWFWDPNDQTGAVSFEIQIRKPEATGFEAKAGKIVDLGFEAKSRNLHSSSLYAWCRPHTASLDLSIVCPPSTRHVLDHLWSSAPGLLLLPRSSSMPTKLYLSPAHHEISKHDSPQ
jgi:hypothetical protein